jgi:hypothetical protein
MNIPPPVFDEDPPLTFGIDEVYHAEQGDILKDFWGAVKKSEDINANTRDLERKVYGHARYLRGGQESDEKFHMGHVEDSPEEGWRQRNLRELVNLRAMNANIQLRSAEKARKGRTPGPINCSPENVMIKHEGSTRYARSTPQYYYTDELPQGKDNVTRFKPEPPNDPA